MLVADPQLIASPVVLAPNWYASEPCSTASVQNASSNGIQVQPLAPAMAVLGARDGRPSAASRRLRDRSSSRRTPQRGRARGARRRPRVTPPHVTLRGSTWPGIVCRLPGARRALARVPPAGRADAPQAAREDGVYLRPQRGDRRATFLVHAAARRDRHVSGYCHPTAVRLVRASELAWTLGRAFETKRTNPMIREDIRQKFPDLFGKKQVNGREVEVEETIATLTRELRPEIAAALTARRELLASPRRSRKYAWPGWDEKFEDPVSGKPWTFRQIIQGLVDNFLGRDSEWRWRLNDETPIPSTSIRRGIPGLELTGPWHPLDMAFNALNSPAPMNMPDFEDARRTSSRTARLERASRDLRGPAEREGDPRGPLERSALRGGEEGKTRSYKIDKPPAQWPTRLARPPSIHVRYDHVVVDGEPRPGSSPSPRSGRSTITTP